MLSPAVRADRPLVYVPNLGDGTVSVIDQSTLAVIDTLPVGREPQHVVPAWDLRTLWVNNTAGNSLAGIDPTTGRLTGPPIPVADPYNLYFTPDGHSAVVMAEALHRIDFRDPHTFALQHSVDLPATAPRRNALPGDLRVSQKFHRHGPRTVGIHQPAGQTTYPSSRVQDQH
jgi:YVTN family beta-propeller protein